MQVHGQLWILRLETSSGKFRPRAKIQQTRSSELVRRDRSQQPPELFTLDRSRATWWLLMVIAVTSCGSSPAGARGFVVPPLLMVRFFGARDIAALGQATTSYLLSHLVRAMPVSITAALTELFWIILRLTDNRLTLLYLGAMPKLLVQQSAQSQTMSAG